MEFQIISDIHLFQNEDISTGTLVNIKPTAPYLLIAGDVDCPIKRPKQFRAFFDRTSPHFKLIFYVLGNHEYYYSSCAQELELRARKQGIGPIIPFKEVPTYIKKLLPENVILLHNEAYHFPDSDISIFGTPLWSNINPEAQKTVTDFTYIHGFTPNLYRKQHTLAVKSMITDIFENPQRKWVLLTHHCPVPYLGSDNSVLASAYFADIQDIVELEHIAAVVYGHTHGRMNSGYKFFSNPVGYPGEYKKIKNFKIQI
jgi:predicted phosphodiesterase